MHWEDDHHLHFEEHGLADHPSDYDDASRRVVATMDLESKCLLGEGATCWTTRADDARGLPAVFLADGPHGVRKERVDALGLASAPATCFPTASSLGSAWDPDLAASVGRALGVEARAQGVDVLLGPGINIKRHPLGGRNFESAAAERT
mmetsp:Transcript_36405/g.112625  ORF Transcript_36405/g.112625 Transcript_36405/m.112625 type:complete len:149 (-) Transcript_36405:455-901(-)